MLCGAATGSDHKRMRNYTFCTTTIAQNVSLRMIDRATGSDVTTKGSLGCAHAQRGVPVLSWGVFTGNDVTPKGWKGVEKCTDFSVTFPGRC